MAKYLRPDYRLFQTTVPSLERIFMPLYDLLIFPATDFYQYHQRLVISVAINNSLFLKIYIILKFPPRTMGRFDMQSMHAIHCRIWVWEQADQGRRSVEHGSRTSSTCNANGRASMCPAGLPLSLPSSQWPRERLHLYKQNKFNMMRPMENKVIIRSQRKGYFRRKIHRSVRKHKESPIEER